ncbi:hypothetical protein PL8927_900144 [Planktothrix serta PCC 8927]|uniref:Uncharacterized protein n=1 Tax=Planktothrix serta PCC 8927 TaxID=671068 RepID=A0A7Z9BZW3_9CYAN|nr:hypothetical protein PL8927_900144 [Planktothrix serta PCC 8927]
MQRLEFRREACPNQTGNAHQDYKQKLQPNFTLTGYFSTIC